MNPRVLLKIDFSRWWKREDSELTGPVLDHGSLSGGRSLGTMPAGGRQPNQMRSALVDAGGWEPWCTPGGGGGWEPWGIAGGSIENGSSPGSAMVHDLTVADEDVDVLECGVCYHPLKPPIFHSSVPRGMWCDRCAPRASRTPSTATYVASRCPAATSVQRCHAMEGVVDSVRVLCPHAPYGCGTTIAYHAREEHLLECPHAPCHCPGDTCGFVGPVLTLIAHLKAVHGWPCTAEVRAGESFGVYLCGGFNFLTAVRGSTQYLLLLNMASTPFGHAISAVWISCLAATMNISSSAPATSRNMTCELELCFMQFKQVQLQRGHYERSRFQVECMCPSNGLPDPNDSFQFFVPKCVGGNEALVHVTAVIFI